MVNLPLTGGGQSQNLPNLPDVPTVPTAPSLPSLTTTPSMAPTPSSVVSSPTSYIIETPTSSPLPTMQSPATYTSDQVDQLISNIPQVLQELSPDEQTKLLSSLMSTNILDSIFNSLDQAPSNDAFNAIIDTLFQNGNLSQVAGDNSALSDTVVSAMKDSVQKTMVQTLVQAKNNPASSGDAPLTLTIPTPNAAKSVLGQPQGQEQLQGPVPVNVQAFVQFPANLASMLGDTATQAMKQFLAQNFTLSNLIPQKTDGGTQLLTQTPEQVQLQQQVEELVSQLLTLNISNPQDSQSPGIQLLVPMPPDPSGFPKAVSELQQKMQTVVDQFSTLQQFVTDQKIDPGPVLQTLLAAPQGLLQQLKSMPINEPTFLMMTAFVDNSKGVETAVAQRGMESEASRFNMLQTIASVPLGAVTIDMMADKQQRQLIFDQILLGVPNLLNFYKVKDAVEALAANLKGQNSARLQKYKILVFNAAREAVIIAHAKPNPEYNDMGIFHEELRQLALKVLEIMPDSADKMTLEEMELIAYLLISAFEVVKASEPVRFPDILKRYPRTTLYFLTISSPLCDGIGFPSLPVALRGDIVPQELEIHLSRIVDVLQKFEKMQEFLKHQPRVLELFIKESISDPASPATKNSIKIVQKAIADCSNIVDLEE